MHITPPDDATVRLWLLASREVDGRAQVAIMPLFGMLHRYRANRLASSPFGDVPNVWAPRGVTSVEQAVAFSRLYIRALLPGFKNSSISGQLFAEPFDEGDGIPNRSIIVHLDMGKMTRPSNEIEPAQSHLDRPIMWVNVDQIVDTKNSDPFSRFVIAGEHEGLAKASRAATPTNLKVENLPLQPNAAKAIALLFKRAFKHEEAADRPSCVFYMRLDPKPLA
jgi:hypothetical protein